MTQETARTVTDIEPTILPKDALGEGGRDGRSTVTDGQGKALNGAANDHAIDPLLQLLRRNYLACKGGPTNTGY